MRRIPNRFAVSAAFYAIRASRCQNLQIDREIKQCPVHGPVDAAAIVRGFAYAPDRHGTRRPLTSSASSLGVRVGAPAASPGCRRANVKSPREIEDKIMEAMNDENVTQLSQRQRLEGRIHALLWVLGKIDNRTSFNVWDLDGAKTIADMFGWKAERIHGGFGGIRVSRDDEEGE
jgi:predicted signal transduction protein with EAL and GGDEF domain